MAPKLGEAAAAELGGLIARPVATKAKPGGVSLAKWRLTKPDEVCIEKAAKDSGLVARRPFQQGQL